MPADENAPTDPQGEQPAPGEAIDPVERLQRLAELREQGVLTEDEYTAEKRNILQS
ncbi:MAG TPA: SHOCT domain-containing protein [Gaiellaceae bacterium]|nr:SHOCT domain-containing protein [Gaiellaceae bacterium]